MADAPIQLLEQVPLFTGLPHHDLERVARSFKERHFSAGDTVAAEGSGGVGFFVIGEGTASVDVHGEKRAQLGPGDYFGEIALIDDQGRDRPDVLRTDFVGLSPARRDERGNRLEAAPGDGEAAPRSRAAARLSTATR